MKNKVVAMLAMVGLVAFTACGSITALNRSKLEIARDVAKTRQLQVTEEHVSAESVSLNGERFVLSVFNQDDVLRVQLVESDDGGNGLITNMEATGSVISTEFRQAVTLIDSNGASNWCLKSFWCKTLVEWAVNEVLSKVVDAASYYVREQFWPYFKQKVRSLAKLQKFVKEEIGCYRTMNVVKHVMRWGWLPNKVQVAACDALGIKVF